MAKYGKTWWGNKWLDTLKNIDFTNRLPRGRTYANTGRVYDIQINGNMISAKVKGNYASYYNVKIMLKSFNTNDKKIITEVVNNSFSILSSLLNNELPKDLFNKLSQLGIKLFPESWNDISGDCDCPDYAMPCKHIAGLIYMISNEIDKNPFTAFNIHNCDLLSLIPDFDKVNTDKVDSLDDIFLNFEDEYLDVERTSLNNKGNGNLKNVESLNNYDKEKIFRNIDFSQVPDLFDHIFALLTPEPLFYEKDFKKSTEEIYKLFKRKYSAEINSNHILPKNMRKSIRITNNDSNFEIEEERLEKDFTIMWGNVSLLDDFTINLNRNYNIDKILNHGNKKESFFKIYEKDLNKALIALIIDIPHHTLYKYNYTIRYLYFLSQFARELIRKSAFIPELIEDFNNQTIIRWVIALFDEKLVNIYNDFIRSAPNNLLTYNNKMIPVKEQVKTLLSLILSQMIYSILNINLSKNMQKKLSNPVFRLFYLGERQKFNSFETKLYTNIIKQWLSNLNIRERDYNLFLKINDEKNENFAVDLEVSFDDNAPEEVYYFISDKKNYKQIDKKIELLSDIHLIKDHLPKLGNSIDAKKPMTFSLEDFSVFFLEIMPLLEIMGVSIILPKSLQKVLKPRLVLNLKMKLDNDEMSYISLKDLVDFDWMIHIGNELIDEIEFKKLLEKSDGLVKIANEYVVLDKTEIKSILNKINKPLKLNNNEIMQSILSEDYDNWDVEVDDNLSKLLKNRVEDEEIKVPNNLNATLRPYQEKGFTWLIQNIKVNFGSILADDMGLGKTVQVLTAILHLKNNDLLNNKKILIIVPTSLLSNWKKEIKTFTPSLTSHIYHGTDRIFKNDVDITLTSYGLIRRDINKFKNKKWFLLIIDEAQNIKNPQTQQTKNIKSIKADHKIALTGTPLENRLLDYWSIFDFTNKKYLDNINKFKKKYIIPIEKNRDKNRLDIFKKITKPFILRRLKTDKSIIKDLPKKIENNVYCNLTPSQTALYQSMIDSILDQIEGSDGMKRKGLVLKLINNLKQVCNHPSQFKKKKTAKIEESGKLEVLLNILINIEENSEKVLIFTQYVEMGKIIKKTVQEELSTEVDFLHGSQTRKTRDKIIDDFQNNTQKRILILSLKAGGTGLNLTAANNVIHYDLWWNPAVENQATDRAYRIGQKENVMVYRLITTGTFEEKIDDIIQNKKELADLTVGEGENFITELNDTDLKEILRLRG
ncbi:MAG: DEAD/DEAH box helicase [Methanobrevibacter sp.]|jgi:SNF2 family DNA or RNA helicase/uncharacterized Zn finger protein|nr:DEAD/DEAH box helicase [Candidatus Methanovirga procula]